MRRFSFLLWFGWPAFLFAQQNQFEREFKVIQNMSLQEKIAQLIFIDIRKDSQGRPVTNWSRELGNFVREYPVGGIIFFRSNFQNAKQVRQLLVDIQKDFSGILPFLAVDEEGGIISRLKNLPDLGYTGLPPAFLLSQQEKSIEQAHQRGEKIGKLLAQLGFQVNMAPIADLFPTTGRPGVIGSRAFSKNPAQAGSMVAAFVSAMQSQGVASVLKHFPGHGYAIGDPHSGGSIYNKTWKTWLEEGHIEPFRAGVQAEANFVMLGHFRLPHIIGNQTPASLSSFVIGNMLRRELGFDGIVISDSLDMQAIKAHWNSAEAAIHFLQAGGDMILMPPKPLLAIQGILAAVEQGQISQERLRRSVLRVLHQKHQMSLLTTQG